MAEYIEDKRGGGSCSECGIKIICVYVQDGILKQIPNYCPNCGADLRKKLPVKEPAPTKPYDLLYEEGGANTT